MNGLYKASLLALALQYMIAQPAVADELDRGADVILEGVVVSIVSDDAFWFEQAGLRVLVYHHLMLPGELHNGQHLRVHGQVSDDWMRLAETEVNAQRIERQSDLASAD